MCTIKNFHFCQNGILVPKTARSDNTSILQKLLKLFATCAIFAATAGHGAIELKPIFDGGQFWIPRTYIGHVASGWSNAVDFYWIDPQIPNGVRSATQHAVDGYDSAAE